MKSPLIASTCVANLQLAVSCYTVVKPLIRNAVVLTFFFGMSVSARGQVVLKLNSRRFNDYAPIKVTLLNTQSQSISMCVSQQWILKPRDDVGVANTPLIMQVQSGRKWVTVLNGVDLGRSEERRVGKEC